MSQNCAFLSTQRMQCWPSTQSWWTCKKSRSTLTSWRLCRCCLFQLWSSMSSITCMTATRKKHRKPRNWKRARRKSEEKAECSLTLWFRFLVCIISFFPSCFISLTLHPFSSGFFSFFFSFLFFLTLSFCLMWREKKNAVCGLFVICLASFSTVFLLFIILRLPCAAVRRLKSKN